MLSSASNISKFILDVVEITFVGVAVFILTYLFIGQPLQISGDSMHPTLVDGEQIVAEKISGKIKRGDIVVFAHPENPQTLIIKRVIGLPGEGFKISANKVYIDNMQLDESYSSNLTQGKGYLQENVEYTVPHNAYVVLGDNRENSIDSRDWGYLEKSKIVGKSFVVYYPLTKVRISDTNVGVKGLVETGTKFFGKLFDSI